MKKMFVVAAIALMIAAGAFAAGQTEASKSGEIPQVVMERPLWLNSNPEDKQMAVIREKIKEAIGIDVVIVGQVNPSNQYEKPNLMLAAGETLDIFQVPSSTVNGWRRYMADDLILPLNDLLDRYGQDFVKRQNPEAFKFNTDPEGNIWAVADEQPANPNYFFMRKDWLDQLGLTAPETVEEFERVMLAFKQLGCEGFTPLWSNALGAWLAGAYIPTATANYQDTDGKVKPWFTHPGYKQYLETMRRFYEKSVIHKEYFTLTYQQSLDIFMSGRSGSSVNWKGLNYLIDEETMQKNIPTAELTFLKPLRGPAGAGTPISAPVTADVMITASSKVPEAAMRYLNWSMGTDEGWLLTFYGIENQDYRWVDRSKGLLTKLTDLPERERYYYAIFASARTTYNYLKFSTSEKAAAAASLVNDPARFPLLVPVDFGVYYDTAKFSSTSKLTDMNTLINESFARIVTGASPVSEWDNFLAQWYRMGGTEYIDFLTTTYNASR